MTRDEARMLLEGDKKLLVDNIWYFRGTYMSCDNGCCDDGFKDIEETLDYIEKLSGGDWDKVTYF